MMAYPAVLALTAWVAFSGPSRGQSATEAARDTFVACVREAAAEQFRALGLKQMAVELAFQSCATEEQVIIAAGTYAGAPAATVMNTVALFKLKLKQDIISRFP